MQDDNERKLPPGILRLLEGLSIRDWTRREANEVLLDVNYGGNQVDLESVLVQRRISRTISFSLQQTAKGILIPREGGFTINLNPRYAHESYACERRFTVAHEVGHTYFYDINGEYPQRYSWIENHTGVEEIICDSFASELLMPYHSLLTHYEVKSHTSHEPVSILNALIELSQVYGISYFALALRIIRELNLWEGILLCCSRISKYLNTQEGDKAIRVLWALFPRTYDRLLFFPRPESKNGPFMKLGWKFADDLFPALVDRRSIAVAVRKREINRLVNLRKIFIDRVDEPLLNIGIVKINKCFHMIPTDEDAGNKMEPVNILLISVPM